MKLTVVRHAEVEEKYIGKYNGHNDIGLSEKGKIQAQKLAKHFEKSSFDALYCSDLQRARLTLEPFVQKGQAIYTEALREKSWGRHEGLGFDEICNLEKQEYKDFNSWLELLDGESIEEFLQRVESFFKRFIFEEKESNILLITHAGVIRALITILKNISYEESFSFAIPYGAYMEYDGENIEIVTLFET
jgi:alpha-ribazole phosphatase/probable phosphoglycerate mutase